MFVVYPNMKTETGGEKTQKIYIPTPLITASVPTGAEIHVVELSICAPLHTISTRAESGFYSPMPGTSRHAPQFAYPGIQSCCVLVGVASK